MRSYPENGRQSKSLENSESQGEMDGVLFHWAALSLRYIIFKYLSFFLGGGEAG